LANILKLFVQFAHLRGYFLKRKLQKRKLRNPKKISLNAHFAHSMRKRKNKFFGLGGKLGTQNNYK